VVFRVRLHIAHPVLPALPKCATGGLHPSRVIAAQKSPFRKNPMPGEGSLTPISTSTSEKPSTSMALLSRTWACHRSLVTGNLPSEG
jgi:hypothetical protein